METELALGDRDFISHFGEVFLVRYNQGQLTHHKYSLSLVPLSLSVPRLNRTPR